VDSPHLGLICVSVDDKAPSRLTWHVPEATASYGLPGFPNVEHVVNGSEASRPVRRQMRRIERLDSLLSGSDVVVGGTSVTRTTGSERLPNVSVFTATVVNEHQHYLFTRGLDERIDEFDAVEIVTGSCLWSARAMRGLGAGGAEVPVMGARPRVAQRVERFVESPSLSLYERENARRVTRLIADLLVALGDVVDVTVRADVPGVAYYCYLLDAFGHGLVSRAQLLDWFTRVDSRRERIVALVGRELSAWTQSAGLDAAPELDTTDAMLAIDGNIRDGIDHGQVPSVGRLAGRFADGDETWAAMFDVAEPHTFHDLVELSFAREMLQPTRDRVDTRARLTLVVDDYSEGKIYQRAVQLASRLRPESHRLIGLYPLTHVLTTKDGHHGPMFLQDPGAVTLDGTDNEISYDDVLGAAYGCPAPTGPVVAHA
jgi:hypothetical protein